MARQRASSGEGSNARQLAGVLDHERDQNPIVFVSFFGGAIRRLIAPKMTLNWPSYCSSSASNRRVLVLTQHGPHSHERAHDLDVYTYGALASKDARKHRDALFGEGERQVATPAASRL
jgi:hypothetical protein